MFALRRFRLFLLVALLVAGSLYYLTGRDTWSYPQTDKFSQSAPRPAAPKEPDTYLPEPAYKRPPPIPLQDELSVDLLPTTSKPYAPAEKTQTKPAVEQETTPTSSSSTSTSSNTPAKTNDPKSTPGSKNKPEPVQGTAEGESEGEGRHEVDASLSNGPRARWQKPIIHNPIAEDDLIRLPTGAAQKLPKIQATFTPESAAARKDRISKLNTIKESFKHAWKGYKEYGLPHDEVRPISKSHRDPFMGWGATMVDTLDTLWIMSLKDEFEEAVSEIAKIDFKTSARKDIPLFETVIRYLGGLIAAYDLSNAKYPVLLEKAEELAEILMGAFDTPNRMPMTFYNWAPSYTSQSHRAPTHATMAELGSLSVEMTRLAQLTGKHEYYDAIARITNELEKWQSDTLIPGLWPLKVDASGCQKVERKSSVKDDEVARPILDDDDFDFEQGDEEPAMYEDTEDADLDEQAEAKNLAGDKKKAYLEPRSAMSKPSRPRPRPPTRRPPQGPFVKVDQEILAVDCEKQGLAPVPNAKTQTFGIGGQADSTYEYLPKMYALLRGRSEQYKTMYLKSAQAIRKELLFRPMIKDRDRNILFAAKRDLSPKSANSKLRDVTTFEVTHLSCFVGGMFGLGAKLFDLKDDLQTAKELTEGCVWAYESMPTGVMAETAAIVPCEDMEPCAWNQTRWLQALDPDQESRFAAVDAWNKNQQDIYERSHRAALNEAASGAGVANDAAYEEEESRRLERRTEESVVSEEPPTKTLPKLEGEDTVPGKAGNEGLIRFVPKVALSHDKFVSARIQEERLPASYTKITDRHYGLRPEAIESVFYMYRLTGDDTWRQKGWKMFEAVQTATQTETANAGMADVTSHLGELEDVMESFWLAETLKYFYLLFDDPERLSLDNWVLNTEAHPLAVR